MGATAFIRQKCIPLMTWMQMVPCARFTALGGPQR